MDGWFTAARSGDALALGKLLDEYKDSIDINACDETGLSALGYAVENGHVDSVRLLLQRGANAKQDNHGHPPLLQTAALEGRSDIAVVLIAGGAKVNEVALTQFGTALHAAAFHGYLDVVRVLLEAGTDPDIRDGDGATALDLATRLKHVETAVALSTFRTRASSQVSTTGISSLSLWCA
jgi:ankyrin repeat protein